MRRKSAHRRKRKTFLDTFVERAQKDDALFTSIQNEFERRMNDPVLREELVRKLEANFGKKKESSDV